MDSSACRFHNQRRVYLMFFAIGMLLAEIVGLGFALLPVVVVMRSGRDYPTVLSLFTHFHWKVLFSFGSLRGIAFSFEILAAIMVLVAAIVTTFRMVGSFEVTSPTAWWWVLLAACPLVLSSCFIGHLWIRPPVAFGLYAFLRATHLHSGVSPLMALIFLGSAGFTLIGGGTWRVMMLEDRPLPQPFLSALGETASFRGVAVVWTRVVDLLEHPAKEVILAASVLVLSLGFAFIYFGLRKIGLAYSIDGEQFDILFILLAFGIYTMFSLALLRFAFAWYALRHLLRRLYFHPSRDSYKNLQLAAKPTRLDLKQIRLYEARPGLTAIEYGLGRARAIIRIAREADVKRPIPDLVSDIVNCKDLETTLINAETQLEAVLEDRDWSANVAARRTLYATMINLSSIVVSLFEPVWRMSARQPLLLPLRVTVNSVEDKPTVDRVLLEQAELFVAARVADFARHVFPLLINLVGFAMPAVLAMMLALSVYPFPAHDTLLWVGWTVLLTAIAVSLCVFVSINRNSIISMISGSDPGQFNWDSTFTVHFLLFAVFPILTILGAQFPHALTGIFSWIGSIFGGGASR